MGCKPAPVPNNVDVDIGGDVNIGRKPDQVDSLPVGDGHDENDFDFQLGLKISDYTKMQDALIILSARVLIDSGFATGILQP